MRIQVERILENIFNKMFEFIQSCKRNLDTAFIKKKKTFQTVYKHILKHVQKQNLFHRPSLEHPKKNPRMVLSWCNESESNHSKS